MPLAAILSAASSHHTSLAVKSLLRAAWLIVIPLLVLALGTAVGSWPCGLAAACLLDGRLLPANAPYIQNGYTLVLLATALALVRWDQKRDARSAWVLGGVLGAGFLFRSPLAFLPLALACREWARAKRRPATLWPVFASYLFLLPWIYLQRTLHGGWQIFESGEADANIVTGALGLVRTIASPAMERHWGTLLPPRTINHVLTWAVGEVARHPLRYAVSCYERVVLVLGFHPLLASAAGAGFIWTRGVPGLAALRILAIYFLVIHCFMSVQENYFIPLWPLLAVLAAAWAAPLAKTFPLAKLSRRFVDLIVGTAAAAACAAAAVACVTVLAYSLRLHSFETPAQAPALEGGRDAWLWGYFTRQTSRPLSAEELGRFRRALDDGDDDRALHIEWAWAAFRAGRPESIFALEPMRSPEDVRLRILRAFVETRQNRWNDALGEFWAALELRRAPIPVDAASREFGTWKTLETASLAAADTAVAKILVQNLTLVERLDFLAGLSRLDQSRADQWAVLGAAAAEPPACAADAVERDREIARNLTPLARSSAVSAKFFSDKGVCEFRTGNARAAQADLRTAIALRRDWLAPYVSLAAIALGRKDGPAAIKIYDEALRRALPGRDIELKEVVVRERDELARRLAAK
jgi:tetratricopeptide (TPR) repeat protein